MILLARHDIDGHYSARYWRYFGEQGADSGSARRDLAPRSTPMMRRGLTRHRSSAARTPSLDFARRPMSHFDAEADFGAPNLQRYWRPPLLPFPLQTSADNMTAITRSIISADYTRERADARPGHRPPAFQDGERRSRHVDIFETEFAGDTRLRLGSGSRDDAPIRALSPVSPSRSRQLI